ncbi:membrane protein [Microbacterium phage Cece]|nr:membrane protein [Microbacterium phage Cece]
MGSRKRRLRRLSGLQRRIAEGKADPISDREREQWEELRQSYIRRFSPEGVAEHRKAKRQERWSDEWPFYLGLVVIVGVGALLVWNLAVFT